MTTGSDSGGVERQKARALARWEGEGGALGLSNAPGDTLDELDLRILNRLGAAVLGEWNNISTDLQRALFQRASTPHSSGDGARLKSEIARFLHAHKDDE